MNQFGNRLIVRTPLAESDSYLIAKLIKILKTLQHYGLEVTLCLDAAEKADVQQPQSLTTTVDQMS